MANKFPCPAKGPVPTIAPIPEPNTHSVALNFGAQEAIMQVEAIYDHGKLEFVSPLKLKHERFRVMVTVPDHELDQAPAPDLSLINIPADLLERAQVTLSRMKAIKNAPLPADDQIPELTEKQLERIDAYALRDEIKGMR